MDYIALINRFWSIDDQQPHTDAETRLYFFLLKLFNSKGQGKHWPESIQLTDGLMCMSVGFKDPKTLGKARAGLEDRKLIHVDYPGKGNRAGQVYTLLTYGKNPEVKGSTYGRTSGKNPQVNPEVDRKPTEQHRDEPTEQPTEKILRFYIYKESKQPDIQTTKQTLCVAGRDVAEVRLAWVWLIENKKPKPASVEPQKKGSKKKPPQVPARTPEPPSIVSQIRKLIETQIPGYYWSAKDGGAARDIAAKLKHAIEQKSQGTAATDEDVINALTVLITRSGELPTFYRFTDLPALNGKFNEIITQLRSSRKAGQQTGNGRVVAPAHASPEQRHNKVAALFAAIDKQTS